MMKNSTSVCCALAFSALFTLAASTSLSAAGSDIVLYAKDATVVAGAWTPVNDGSAAGGARLATADADQPKLPSALVAPNDYFELTFTPQAGTAYHLWIRGKAENDGWTNDSVFVQFSGSVTSSGAKTDRIGTTSAEIYSLEPSSGAGEQGWGWEDNAYGGLGQPLYFDGTPQRLRIQVREDGLSIDQIVLSPVTYASRAPGTNKNDTTILPETGGSSSGTTSGTTGTTSGTSGGGSVAWAAVTHATASGGTITKSGGCDTCADAGGISQQAISDGTISFNVTSGQSLVAGVGRNTGAIAGYNVDYAFKFEGTTTYEVREAGVYKTEGSFSSSDTFSITTNGSVVTYYKNNKLVYTSKTPRSGSVVMEASLVSSGASVKNAQVGGSTSTAPPPPLPSDPPPSDPPPSGSKALRVLQWNTHHGGYGTDGVYSPNRIATWAASFTPDIVMFNEIEKNDYWGNQDQPEVYKSLLEQKTGKTWYYVFAQEFGNWSSAGKGNLILSSYPIQISDRYELVHNSDRSAAVATITVNSRDITLISTHLDPYDQSLRLTQAKEVTGWAALQPENRIITGDMNAWPDQTSIGQYDTLYNDSWAVASNNGTATAFSGNAGETKSGRIDYIFYSKGASNLSVVSSRVYDTRDSNGVMPSDHRPVLTVFSVK